MKNYFVNRFTIETGWIFAVGFGINTTHNELIFILPFIAITFQYSETK